MTIRNEIQSSEMRKIELSILNQIHDICMENGFRYSLCGGTLLGSVRHKGFIPWDDDIDILMPYPDYLKFLAYCKKNIVPFGIVSQWDGVKYYDGIAKVYDKNTIITDEIAYYEELGIGLHVDICPIVGLGSDYDEALQIYNSSRIYRELLNAKSWRKYKRSKTRSIIYEPIRLLFFLLSRLITANFLIKKINKTFEHCEFHLSRFAGCVYGSYRQKEILPKDVFEQYELCIFEEHSFYRIVKYDIYLKSIYGDYMTIPTKEKQVSHHYFKAFYR